MSVKLENLTGNSNEGKIKLAKISLNDLKFMCEGLFKVCRLI